MLCTVLVTDGHSVQPWGTLKPRDDGNTEPAEAAAGDPWCPGEGGRAP